MKKSISILGVFVFIALFTKCKVSTSPEQKLPKYVEISFAPGEAPANRYYLLVLFKGEIAEEEAIAFSPVCLVRL